VVLF
jgi:hypothetical protein